MEDWTVRTDVFDGPMDLLLHLVKREGIDLADFPVRQVTDAYLGWLDRMRELHLGVAAEFLVMAATLCWLKSLELLPRPPSSLEDEEDGEDPREALARKLREYQAYREAADRLDERVQVGREVFVRAPQPVDPADRPVRSPIDGFGLLDVYYDLLTRKAAPEPEIRLDDSGPDLVACCRRVLEWLPGDLGELLASIRSRVERIVTFVAVLEMARLQWVDVLQEEHLGTIRVELRPGAELDLARITGELVKEAS